MPRHLHHGGRLLRGPDSSPPSAPDGGAWLIVILFGAILFSAIALVALWLAA